LCHSHGGRTSDFHLRGANTESSDRKAYLVEVQACRIEKGSANPPYHLDVNALVGKTWLRLGVSYDSVRSGRCHRLRELGTEGRCVPFQTVEGGRPVSEYLNRQRPAGVTDGR